MRDSLAQVADIRRNHRHAESADQERSRARHQTIGCIAAPKGEVAAWRVWWCVDAQPLLQELYHIVKQELIRWCPLTQLVRRNPCVLRSRALL